MLIVPIRTVPKASPCQGRCQKSSIFDGGVVKTIVFSPSVALVARQLPHQREPWCRANLKDKLKFEADWNKKQAAILPPACC
jgi:hypothetical protein